MNLLLRAIRHTRLTARNYRFWGDPPSPPFLILFINSVCNQTCEHCFYWRKLNRKDDLSLDEFRALSQDLGRVENLNLSGGEPFLRTEFAEVCQLFIRNNGVKQIYVPTNGTTTDRTIRAIESVLENRSLQLFVLELSLDGMPEFHNSFRGMRDGFEKAMETYDAAAALQKRDPRLRIHSIATATAANMPEVKRLASYLYKRCPAMDHMNVALLRGDRKNPMLSAPPIEEYRQLYQYVRGLWSSRERGRYGAIVEPMLQWAKARTAEERRQVIPCTAGKLTAVVHANGDVAVCENHPPIGNLRERSFREIWRSQEASALRQSIAAKQCWCTNEMFLWPSIVFQPTQLVQVMLRSGALTQPRALPPVTVEPEPEREAASLKVLQ